MDKQEVQSIGFQLIGHAGDAFNHFYKAIDLARAGDIAKANLELEYGQHKLSEAHKAQTKLLVAEANEENVEFSVILVHAQDHLMTTIMFERVAKEFVLLYEERTR